MGEATPYCDLPPARIKFIGKIMPRVKLIITLRNPVDRLWSSGLMHLVQGRKREFEEISESEFLQFLEGKEILKQGFYPEILKNWRTTFPPEQLFVCFYDDLVENPEVFLKNILAFLGADYNINIHVHDHINKSPHHQMPEELRKHFLEIYTPSILELSKEFGEKALIWLRSP